METGEAGVLLEAGQLCGAALPLLGQDVLEGTFLEAVEAVPG
jgi:hypothetical protein